MKRIGRLKHRILEEDNFERAYLNAKRGKSGKPAVLEFSRGWPDAIRMLRSQMSEGRFIYGPYHEFWIFDPKKRLICAAPFPQQVVHHALMRICAPYFEKRLIHRTCACRLGKGQMAALTLARRFCRPGSYYLKLDVRKYFDSISHNLLLDQLNRLFKDPWLLMEFEKLIASWRPEQGKGIPIGNLTSQYFANHFLSPLDRFVTEDLRFQRYVRYMDDFVLWSDSRAELKQARIATLAFLSNRLDLHIKNLGDINRTIHGMNFLGYRIFPHIIRLSRQSRRRYHKKLVSIVHGFHQSQWTESQAQQRITSLTSFTQHAQSRAFRRHVHHQIRTSYPHQHLV